jgi:disulfide bond formation protein DsbB
MNRFANPSLSLVALAAVGSAAVLFAALIFQYFGVAPCELCIVQRWPHVFAALLGLLLVIRPQAAKTALLVLGALAMIGNTLLAAYHSGVERGIFEGPDSCTSNPISGTSAGDLLAQIRSAPIVRCDEIAWQMLGVTMPNLNVLASALFAALWIAAIVKSRRAA